MVTWGRKRQGQGGRGEKGNTGKECVLFPLYAVAAARHLLRSEMEVPSLPTAPSFKRGGLNDYVGWHSCKPPDNQRSLSEAEKCGRYGRGICQNERIAIYQRGSGDRGPVSIGSNGAARLDYIIGRGGGPNKNQSAADHGALEGKAGAAQPKRVIGAIAHQEIAEGVNGNGIKGSVLSIVNTAFSSLASKANGRGASWSPSAAARQSMRASSCFPGATATQFSPSPAHPCVGGPIPPASSPDA
jgi:hypothetical protein